MTLDDNDRLRAHGRAGLHAIVSNARPQPAGSSALRATTSEETGVAWWARARPAQDFLAEAESDIEWLEPRLIARSAMTLLHAPRGVGKSNLAHAVAVAMASRGLRVLLLDRDNPPRTTRKSLRGWGAASLSTLRVLTRSEVPSLMSPEAWRQLPADLADAIILDAIDSAAEGAGEQKSELISRAMAPLLDLVHQDGGPGLLVLSNTTKDGTRGRGSGVIEDRADIVFEVRDATGLTPSGQKAWWCELPSADRAEWVARAERRAGVQKHRLALIATKFRDEEEPLPFALELDRSTTLWTLRDITDELEAAGDATKAVAAATRGEREQRAVETLAVAVADRSAANDPLVHGQAVELVRQEGVSRDAARILINRETGRRWRQHRDPARRGQPVVLLPVSDLLPQETLGLATASGTMGPSSPISAGLGAEGPQE